MTKELSVLAIVEATAARRRARRAFMKTAATGVAAVGGLSLLAACGDDDNNMSVPFPTPTPTPAAVSTDVAVLNFALNLEYLEAQFYSYAFTAAARAAGVVASNGLFDPYASPTNFLLGAYIFEDIGVTAYKGASPVISSMYLEAAAGILAAEAYHAGLVRTILYTRGVTNADLITATTRISDARDLLDGTTGGTNGDDDQGIAGTNIGQTNAVSNIVPTDSNGIAYSRSVQQVHNIAYLNATGANRTRGGFFPAGTNNPNPAFTVGLG